MVLQPFSTLARVVAGFFVVTVFTLIAGTRPAMAVPSYADQTGQDCSACHVGAFGPQLTPFGREFKIAGYTARATDVFTAPVSAMAIASYLHNASDVDDPEPHYSSNDNTTLDEFSLFLAGGYGHFGAFGQFTYDGVGRASSWDNVDLRFTDTATLAGKGLTYGVSLNNNPGIQDPWNTVGWGFPYTESDLIPSPDAALMSSGGLGQTVLGASVYGFWNEEIYAEAGLYWKPANDFLDRMGSDPMDAGGLLDGSAPYFRVAYSHDMGSSNYEIGVFGLRTSLFPEGDKSAGKNDTYTDLGVDASYQFLGDSSLTYTVNFKYTSEHQDLAASYLLGNAAGKNRSLNEARMDASAYWDNTYGVTIGAFNVWGSSDPLIYADNTAAKPNSSGLLLQLDATPFGKTGDSRHLNVRVGLQYVDYFKFNGADNNYDGSGRSASDNNTLRLFTWFAF